MHLHKNLDKLLSKRRLYKWNAIQIELHKNAFLHCGLGWPEWTYTRKWGVDKKATFSHKSSKFDTRIWKEEFISSIRNMCAAVESIVIIFKNVEKTRLCISACSRDSRPRDWSRLGAIFMVSVSPNISRDSRDWGTPYFSILSTFQNSLLDSFYSDRVHIFAMNNKVTYIEENVLE